MKHNCNLEFVGHNNPKIASYTLKISVGLCAVEVSEMCLVILCVCAYFIPESPRSRWENYDMQKSRWEGVEIIEPRW